MKNTGFLGSVVLTILLFFCLLLMARETFAVDTETLPDDGKVEIIYPAQALAPYRERRTNWGTTFGISFEQVLPEKFRSQIKTITTGAGVADATYEDLFGSTPVTMIQAHLGAKYNFGLGSLGLSLTAGMGEVDDGRTKGNTSEIHELTLFKKGVGINFVMDNLFPEPYLAPYVEGQLFSFDYFERRYVPDSAGNASENRGGTDLTSAIIFGALIQLNQLDPDSALAAQQSSGLENLFIDLFVSQYNNSSRETDPDLSTSTNFGGGLRMEF